MLLVTKNKTKKTVGGVMTFQKQSSQNPKSVRRQEGGNVEGQLKPPKPRLIAVNSI